MTLAGSGAPSRGRPAGPIRDGCTGDAIAGRGPCPAWRSGPSSRRGSAADARLRAAEPRRDDGPDRHAGHGPRPAIASPVHPSRMGPAGRPREGAPEPANVMSARAFGRTPLDLAFARDQIGLLLAAMLAPIAYLAALGGLALVLLGDDERAWNRSLGTSMTLQIPAETSAPRIEMVLALLRQTAGIAGVRALDTAETTRLLEPWLGTAAAID